MTKAEELILEFHDLTNEINKTKSTSRGNCEEHENAHHDGNNCITLEYKEAMSANYLYGVELGDVCPTCSDVLDNAQERKKLNEKRGYVKNKMHALAKKLKAIK